MTLRLRMLQGATAALYMGPLLAGMAGYGWVMLPPFVSIFVLWLMILRPHQWPQTNAEWLTRQAWLSVLTQVLTQVLLVAVLFGIGRGLGGVLGHLPLFHPVLPVAISFVSIPLSRLFWNSEQALEKGLTIDEVMYPQSQPPVQAAETRPVVPADVAIRPLLDLADDAPLTQVGPMLDDLMDDSTAWARLAALAEALEAAPDRHGALREALIIWTTDPETFAANPIPSAMRTVFGVAGTDARLLSRLLPRAAALARIMPERLAQFPNAADLDRLAALSLPAQVAADLKALMAVVAPRPSASARAARRPASSLSAPTSGMA
jgi:hypothetical protein